MGEVTTKFTADSKDLEAAYEKLYQSNIKMHDQLAQGASQARQLHDEKMGFFSQQIHSLEGMVAGYLTLQSGISLVTGASEEWRQKLSEIAKASEDLNQNLARTMSLAGRVEDIDRMKQFVGSMPGVTPGQAMAAFEGVSTGAMKADKDRQDALTTQTARVTPFGVDLKDFGQFVGQTSDLASSHTPEQVAEMAWAMRQMAGRGYDRLQSSRSLGATNELVKGGVLSPEQAGGLALEATAENVQGTLLRKLADKVTGDIELPDTGGKRPYNAKEQLTAKFSGMSPGERMGSLFNDRSMADAILGTDMAAQLKMIDQQRVADYASRIGQAEQQGLIGRDVSALRGSVTGHEVDRVQAMKAFKEKGALGFESDASALAFERQFVESVGQYTASPTRNYLTMKLFDTVSGMKGGPLELEESNSKIYPRETASLYHRAQSEIAAGGDPSKVLEKILAELQKHTEALVKPSGSGNVSRLNER